MDTTWKSSRTKQTLLILLLVGIVPIYYIYAIRIHIQNWAMSLSGNKFTATGYAFEKDSAAFFLETSFSTTLNYRQACAIESLAGRNPSIEIYVLTTAQIDRNSSTFGALAENYPDIHFYHIDIPSFVAGSEFEPWYHNSHWNESQYANHHLSDALRFLTMKKYGGYYFDLDVIHLRPVTPYRNFAAAQSDGEVAIGAMHFQNNHYVMNEVVSTFPKIYDPGRWSYAGVELFTTTLQRYCQENHTHLMTAEKCKGFNVMPPSSFYPIGYGGWMSYFKDGDIKFDENVIGAHVWNFLSGGFKVQKESNQVYVKLAKTFCPKVFAIAPPEF